MDPRRLLNLACAGLILSGCATLRDLAGQTARPYPAVTAAGASAAAEPITAAPRPTPTATFAAMAPIPNPPVRRAADQAGTLAASPGPHDRDPPPRLAPTARPTARASAPSARRGRTAIADANSKARETSSAEAFVGGMQVFRYEPGRVYEVWTAPLRVTTLTLAPAETIVSKAAGDTVRWQIGETTSGQGPAQRTHVMIKPLKRGLETNLVLATNQRVYLIQLKSGPPEAFNTAVSWDLGAALPPAGTDLPDTTVEAKPSIVTPVGPLDARFRIDARGRPPAWTPLAVMTDGVRTFLRFPPTLTSGEAPGLFVLGEDGETQVVNYRQQAGLWVVDRVFDRAELRIGDKHPKVVRITREGGPS